MSGRGDRAQLAGRVGLVVVALVLLVVPGRLLAAEHASDDELVAYPGPGDVTRARGTTGETWHLATGVVAADHGRIELVEVRPRVVVDSAAADIRVQLCTPGPAGAVSVVAGSLSDVCTVVGQVSGAVVRLRPGARQLVVSVTPRRPGAVRIEGYDVTYLDRGRHGTEHAGSPLRVTAS